MKNVKTLVFLVVVLHAATTARAQADTTFARQRATLFADSLVNSFRYSNFDDYVNISYPGVIKYYGGKNQFREYIRRLRAINKSVTDEPRERVEVMQLLNDSGEWQCVVKKSRETLIDGKKATVVSYLVGQSKDDAHTWKYFDVAYNSVQNIIYIMPDIFDTLAIPQRQIIFQKDHLVSY